MKKIKRFCRLIVFTVLLLVGCAVFFGWIPGERVTVAPPADAPANVQPDLPWELTLVNRDNGLPKEYHLTLQTVRGVQVDRRIAKPLREMLADAEACGFEVHLNSGFRTTAEQQEIFEDKVNEFLSAGYDETTARGLASQWASLPGRSEHELGIAVDIGTETPALYDWLAENSARYGFIQRYPADKTNITGVSHEPWHYRYVGKEAASIMHARGLCLEEYVHQLS